MGYNRRTLYQCLSYIFQGLLTSANAIFGAFGTTLIFLLEWVFGHENAPLPNGWTGQTLAVFYAFLVTFVCLLVWRSLYAPFHLLVTANEQIDKIRIELNSQTAAFLDAQTAPSHKPRLDGSVEIVVIGRNENQIGFLLVTQVRIRNTGLPTSIVDFEIDLIEETGRCWPLQMLQIPTTFSLDDETRQMHLTSEHDLNRKSIEPVGTGAIVGGWLMACGDQLPIDIASGCSAIVRAKDVWNNEIEFRSNLISSYTHMSFRADGSFIKFNTK